MARETEPEGAKVLQLPARAVAVQLKLEPNVDASEVIAAGRRLVELLEGLGQAARGLVESIEESARGCAAAFDAFDEELKRRNDPGVQS